MLLMLVKNMEVPSASHDDDDDDDHHHDDYCDDIHDRCIKVQEVSSKGSSKENNEKLINLVLKIQLQLQ